MKMVGLAQDTKVNLKHQINAHAQHNKRFQGFQNISRIHGIFQEFHGFFTECFRDFTDFTEDFSFTRFQVKCTRLR